MYSRCLGLAVAVLWLMQPPCMAAGHTTEDPRNRIEFWRNNYDELRVQDDALAARAHTIFQRVLQAAGARPGIVPRLFITTVDPWNVSLPIAISDGWIILSKGALEICYRDVARGDDRLAFVLAHEIAHQLKDDFWHMKFFQALDTSKAQALQQQQTLDELRGIAGLTEQVLAKELQADEQGIVYATMAGFDPSAIVADEAGVNFFEEWVRALDPRRIAGIQASPTHPTSPQRAATVKARLRQVMEKVDLFTWGLRFYEAGDYERSIRAFEEFLRFFPSREVYHNLAASHHQLALRYYRLWKPQEMPLAWKLSLTIDPVTRATGAQESLTEVPPQERFVTHLDKAIEFYQMALSLDRAYLPSYSNLGCALLLKGEVYEAIATLQKALKEAPESPEVLNNLGVAFASAENPAKAKTHLLKARELAATYDAPLFNLGKLAHADQHEAEAQTYWQAYMALDPSSPWAEVIRQTLAGRASDLPASPTPSGGLRLSEEVMQAAVGMSRADLQALWGEPSEQWTLPLPGEPQALTIEAYASGVLALVQDETMQFIVVPRNFSGHSALGVAIGDGEADVRARYGVPSRVVRMAQGGSWIYEAQGVAFRLRQGKVVSWQVF
jgi:tetratricopeptide (TPR) repeat protein